MAKPYVLLVPGSFALPVFYDGIVSAVAANGYEVEILHLPTIGLDSGLGRDGPLPTMYDDAAFIAKEVEKLADDGKDVVIVAHSYGGIPTSECCKGLRKEDRQKQGKNGGLVRIAYVTCLVPAIGVSAMGLLSEVLRTEQQAERPTDEEGWLQQESGWMYHANRALSASRTFSDVSPEEGEGWVKRFARHSSVSFTNPLTYAGYKDLPVSYLVCEDDLVIPPGIQRAEIEMIEKESGRKVDVTSIKAGHVPQVSQPQKVIDWIVNVARNA